MRNHKKVILSLVTERPEPWTFWDYVRGGNNPIEEWYQNLSDEALNLFDGILKNASKTEHPINWIGFKRFLKGKYKQGRLWELFFRADKRQHRVIGFFRDQRKQAGLLMGCYHKQNVYTPPDALDTAFKRAKDIREGRATLHERKIKNDI